MMNQMMTNSLKMYNQQEVAELLGCNKETVRILRETGCIKPIKIGRQYMFSYFELEKFQKDFSGLDVSNRENALQSKRYVDSINGKFVKRK